MFSLMMMTEKKFFGTPLPTFLAKPWNASMQATYVMDHLLKKDFFTTCSQKNIG